MGKRNGYRVAEDLEDDEEKVQKAPEVWHSRVAGVAQAQQDLALRRLRLSQPVSRRVSRP